jgi:hypothetical protein
MAGSGEVGRAPAKSTGLDATASGGDADTPDFPTEIAISCSGSSPSFGTEIGCVHARATLLSDWTTLVVVK